MNFPFSGASSVPLFVGSTSSAPGVPVAPPGSLGGAGSPRSSEQPPAAAQQPGWSSGSSSSGNDAAGSRVESSDRVGGGGGGGMSSSGDEDGALPASPTELTARTLARMQAEPPRALDIDSTQSGSQRSAGEYAQLGPGREVPPVRRILGRLLNIVLYPVRETLFFLSWITWLFSVAMMAGSSILVVYSLIRISYCFFLFWLVHILTRLQLWWIGVYHNLTGWLLLSRAEQEVIRLKRSLANANSYEEWLAAAVRLDELCGSERWRLDENPVANTGLGSADYAMLRIYLNRIRQARQLGDVRALMFVMNNAWNRDFCGVESDHPYSGCLVGTKRVVEEFYAQTAEQLDFVANQPTVRPKRSEANPLERGLVNNSSVVVDSPASLSAGSRGSAAAVAVNGGGGGGGVMVAEGRANVAPLTAREKIRFFERARKSYGRTALCLSGGGALALYHIGVVRALLRSDCLPDIVNGSSGGSIVAGMLAIKTDDELRDPSFLTADISTRYGVRWLWPFNRQLVHLLRHGTLMDYRSFAHTAQTYYEAYTFEEAYRRTRRVVSITTSKSGGAKSHSLVLNHITAPNVLIWSAVCASCALPGLMKPQRLLAKTHDGRVVPFFPQGAAWVDGSLQADIPFRRLSELFDVNRFVVSQVNPHVTVFALDGQQDGQSRWLYNASRIVNADIQHRLRRLARMGVIPRLYGQDMSKMVPGEQKYSGHVTIYPRIRFRMQFKLLTHPDVDDMRQYIDGGERGTWGQITRIRNSLILERRLGDNLRRLKREQRDLERRSRSLLVRRLRLNSQLGQNSNSGSLAARGAPAAWGASGAATTTNATRRRFPKPGSLPQQLLGQEAAADAARRSVWKAQPSQGKPEQEPSRRKPGRRPVFARGGGKGTEDEDLEDLDPEEEDPEEEEANRKRRGDKASSPSSSGSSAFSRRSLYSQQQPASDPESGAPRRGAFGLLEAGRLEEDEDEEDYQVSPLRPSAATDGPGSPRQRLSRMERELSLSRQGSSARPGSPAPLASPSASSAGARASPRSFPGSPGGAPSVPAPEAGRGLGNLRDFVEPSAGGSSCASPRSPGPSEAAASTLTVPAASPPPGSSGLARAPPAGGSPAGAKRKLDRGLRARYNVRPPLDAELEGRPVSLEESVAPLDGPSLLLDAEVKRFLHERHLRKLGERGSQPGSPAVSRKGSVERAARTDSPSPLSLGDGAPESEAAAEAAAGEDPTAPADLEAGETEGDAGTGEDEEDEDEDPDSTLGEDPVARLYRSNAPLLEDGYAEDDEDPDEGEEDDPDDEDPDEDDDTGVSDMEDLLVEDDESLIAAEDDLMLEGELPPGPERYFDPRDVEEDEDEGDHLDLRDLRDHTRLGDHLGRRRMGSGSGDRSDLEDESPSILRRSHEDDDDDEEELQGKPLDSPLEEHKNISLSLARNLQQFLSPLGRR